MLILTSENSRESAINGTAYCPLVIIKIHVLTWTAKNIEKFDSHQLLLPHTDISLNIGFLTDDDTKSFCGQCRSRSDRTEHAVLSLIYTVHIFIIDYN